MIAVIEAVFEFLSRVGFFAFDHGRDFARISTRRFLAEYMQPGLQPGDGDLRRHVVGHADEYRIQPARDQCAVMGEVVNAVILTPIFIECAITNRHGFNRRVQVDELPAPLSDHAVAGDSDPEFFSHCVQFPCGEGVRYKAEITSSGRPSRADCSPVSTMAQPSASSER